jgi:hypothetical protein
MIRKTYCLLLFMIGTLSLRSQENFEKSIFYKSLFNIGFQTGFAQYFGDLNTRWNFKSLKGSQAIYIGKEFYKKNFSIKAFYQRHRLSAADENSNDSIQLRRNLSFTTDVDELTFILQFKVYESLFYDKTSKLFLQLGAGYFWFNPYTYYNSQKVYLQPLGTEGQFSYMRNSGISYDLKSISMPIGIEWKLTLSNYLRLCVNFNYRFTSTGYLDDVYGFYAGYESFPSSGEGYNGDLARTLQNRSNDISFGIKGAQRGNLSNDHFMSFGLGLEYQIWKNKYKYRLKYHDQPRPSPEKKQAKSS